MSNAFAPIVRARPNPIFGRPVHQGSPPIDYSPILLLKPFGFRIAPDTLSSDENLVGQRGITPAFGYSAPHPSAGGTLTLLIHALPSAHYEYVCRRSGVEVRYCAEQFENDGSVASTIVKTVKRAMAGEYSRELSAKVFAGQCRLIELGFRQGGHAGYGLRRRLVDHNGNPKALLAFGEQKSLQTDRVVLEPGPVEEVETVRRMFRMFVHEHKHQREIAAILNKELIRTDLGRRWTVGSVHQVLTNEKYIGNNVFNRASAKLTSKRSANPPEMWIRAVGAFPAIVDPELFQAARAVLARRNRQLSDDEMLALLKDLYAKHGRLSSVIIDQAKDLPVSLTYRQRFGSLGRVYPAGRLCSATRRLVDRGQP